MYAPIGTHLPGQIVKKISGFFMLAKIAIFEGKRNFFSSNVLSIYLLTIPPFGARMRRSKIICSFE